MVKNLTKLAPTFGEHIEIVAMESPHGAILDWWRRLDLALHEHFELCHNRPARNRRELEEHIANYPKLGYEFSREIVTLRHHRNTIAHEDVCLLSKEDAISYARDAFGALGTVTLAWPK